MPDNLYDYIQKRVSDHMPGAIGTQPVLGDASGVLPLSQVLREAEQLGRSLTKTKYGIFCRSQKDAAVALLACFSAGKTAVPLSVHYGKGHVDKIRQTVRLSQFITSRGIEEIGKDEAETEELSGLPLIMCTSGTSGQPKGAMISQQNLISNLEDIAAYFAISTEDTWLISRPLYHCAVLTGEFLAALIAGANILFYDGEFQPATILRVLRDNHITVMGGTPTLFYHLSRLALRHKQTLPLRCAVVSGECMTPSVAKQMREAMPDTQIYHVYGLTEASPRVTWLPPEQFDRHPLSVGFPLRSVETRIHKGELLVRGPNVMRGYYNNPAATARALSDGWLHTGDGAEVDREGRLYIKGRLDEMIIRGGMNIYPQEIENALKQIPAIQEVMAYGIQEQGGPGQAIGLKVVTSLTRQEIYAFCRDRLASYQLPDRIEKCLLFPATLRER